MHTPIPEQRASIMPAEKGLSIEEIVELLKQYDFTHQRRLSFEYIMFGGLNDTPLHARQLVKLVEGLDCRVNLIRFHQIPNVNLNNSDEKRMETFRDYLTKPRRVYHLRASRGQDIFAACGLSQHRKKDCRPRKQRRTPINKEQSKNLWTTINFRIAITQGDANGIGMELIFKTFASPEMFELCTPIIYGSPKVAAYHKKALNLDVNFSIIQHANEAKPERLNLLAISDEEVKIEFGAPSEAAAALARKAIDRAVADCKAGIVNAIVNAPISEKHFFAAQEHPTGLSQYIAKQLGETNETLEMSLNECLRITTLRANWP